MEATAIFEMISTMGLPIVLCVFYVWQSTKEKDRLYNALELFGQQLNAFNTTLTAIDKRLENVEDTLKQ